MREIGTDHGGGNMRWWIELHCSENDIAKRFDVNSEEQWALACVHLAHIHSLGCLARLSRISASYFKGKKYERATPTEKNHVADERQPGVSEN